MARHSNSVVPVSSHAIAQLQGIQHAWFHAPAGYGKHDCISTWLKPQARVFNLTLHGDETDSAALAELDRRTRQLAPEATAIILKLARSAEGVTCNGLLELLQMPMAKRQVAVVSRTPPASIYHPLWLCGPVAEIDAETLRLSATETHSLLAAHPQLAEQAIEHFDGWRLGIQLILQRLTQGIDPDLVLIDPKLKLQLHSYLRSQWLADINDQQYALLLSCLIVDNASPSEIARLSGFNVAQVHSALAQLALTISTEGNAVLPPFVRDCLANELNQQPDLQQRLSEQALSYLSANNRPRHAVRCAIRWGNDQQRRAVACQYHNLLLNQGRNQLLEALLSTLSERPFELAVSHAWCLLENSDNNNLSPTLMQLRAKAKPDDREAQGQLDALEAYLCWLGRDLNQALRLTERALTALSNESFAHSKAEQIALSIMHELGDIEQAERRIQPLLANAVCNEQIGHALWAYAKQAWFLADRSLFEPALHLAQAGLAMLEQHDADGLLNNKIYELHHIAIEMLFNLDRLEQAWTQLQQARPLAAECAGQAPARLAILEYNLLIMQEQFEQIPALITQLERSRPLAHIGGLLVFVDGVLTDWWQRTQNKASLHAWLLQKEHVEGEIGRKHGFDVAQLAKAHWGIQSLPQAYDYSDQFLQFSAQLGERLMQIYALDLAIRMRHTHTESASKLGLWVQELADLCIQIDYMTVFRKSAAFYRSMLTQLPAGLSEPAQAFLKRISQALSMNSSAAELSASLATDAITPTEFKVLKLIKRGYSNRQICDSLHISEATLKSHINRSYKKLGVNNRREAKLLLEAVH